MEENEFKSALKYALRRISAQSYLTNDLRKKLKDKKISPQIIEQVLTKCKEFGYLDDQAWIESFVRVQTAKKRGPQAIIQKLIGKGIHQDAAKKVVQKMTSAESSDEAIKILLQTRYRNKNLADTKEKQKVILSLMRRGFSLDKIRMALTGR